MPTETLTQKVEVIKPGDWKSLEDLDLTPGRVFAFYCENLEDPLPLVLGVVGERGLYDGTEVSNSDELALLRDPRSCTTFPVERKILSTKGGILMVEPQTGTIYRSTDLRLTDYTVDWAWIGRERITRAIREEAPLRDLLKRDEAMTVISRYLTEGR